MQSFVETLNRWYDQMLGVPPAKIMSLIGMGAEGGQFPELRPRQEGEGEGRLILFAGDFCVFRN